MAAILVVDDNALNRKILIALLNAEGHQTSEAGDGLEALRLIKADPPDLVISDIVMPGMDGYGLVRALRSDPLACNVRVIFYTAHHHERDAHVLAKACGVDRVLVKPASTADLLHAVEKMLSGPGDVPPDPITDEFDRAHLRLLTNKLAKQAALLAAFDSRLNALMRLGGGLPELREPHALLRKACVDARELFGAAHAVLAVRDSAARGNVFYTTSGIDSDLARPAALRLEIGPLGSMMSSRSTLRLSNPGGRSLGVELPRSYPAAHSILAVPLMTPTQTYGWLYLADKLGAEEFDARDEALISILGTVIGRSYEALSLNRAFAWQSRRLQHSEDRYRTRSKTCTQHVDRVYALLGGANRIMAMARDRDAFCKATCRLAIRQGHFRLAYIEIGAPNAVDMRLVAAAGDVRDSISLARRLAIQSAHQDELLSRALILRRPAVCNELQDDHPPVRLRDEMLSRGYRAVAALPLGNGNAVPGRLVLLTEKPQFFDASEMRLLTQLAGYISLALATARPRVASGEHR